MKDLNVNDRRKKVGWFWLDNEVFDMKLSPSTFVVYAYLVRIADRSSEVATTSIRKMSSILGLSTTTIQKALRELEDKNMIRRETSPDRKVSTFLLISKEEWACQKMTRSTGVSKSDTQVYQKMTQSVSKNDTPEKMTPSKPVDTQAKESSPINNKNKQKSLSKTSLKKEAGEEELLSKIRKLNLKRLREEEALFLILNSSLPVETSLREIKRADGQSGIREPFAYLIRFFGINLSRARRKELLTEDFREENFPEEERGETDKGKELLEEILREHGIDLPITPETYPALYREILNSDALTEKEKEEVRKTLEKKGGFLASEIAVGFLLHKAFKEKKITREEEELISLFRHELFRNFSLSLK